MAIAGLYKGWIGFYAESGAEQTPTPIRWVKGSVQPFKTTGLVSDPQAGGIIVTDKGFRKVYVRHLPFMDAVAESREVFFIDPEEGLPYRVESRSVWGSAAGRGPKHVELIGTREGFILDPPEGALTLTPSSVYLYEGAVNRLNVMAKIAFD